MNDPKIRKPLDKLISAAVFKAHILPLITSKYLYIGLITLATGAILNFASQTYLHNYMIEGKTLPMLSDLILDNLPVIDLSLIYDIFCLVIFAIVFIYIIHRKKYNTVPYIIFLCGIFFIIRGIFIILTPFGNPPQFEGSDPLFNGFSKYELGVYPSGHVGNSFLLLLLVKDRIYRNLLWFCVLVIVVTLFISHGHYSIDIFSGFFFAYAIKSFGEKHLTMFILKNQDRNFN
ncbi:MAG TPA: phosphatase PAP2-related protein [Bacteroidales bacterium]|nr:phosphatase PAP2-related protein [Bacteroidales bacterium]HPR12910.1 phosphatase PAP2-related protein [Bacteroidales bacterium]